MILTEFRALYPSFTTSSDAQVQNFLDLFIILYSASYGTATDHLQGLYTAHSLTTAASGGATTAPVSSRSVGDVSVSYDTSGGQSGSGFNGTNYGVEFIDLMSKFSTPVVANAI